MENILRVFGSTGLAFESLWIKIWKSFLEQMVERSIDPFQLYLLSERYFEGCQKLQKGRSGSPVSYQDYEEIRKRQLQSFVWGRGGNFKCEAGGEMG